MTNLASTLDWNELLSKLAEPFPPRAIQWRAGSTNRDKSKAQALAYVDVREYERRLDELCPGSWSVRFEPWGERRIICRLTIHGVTRSSTGEEGDSPNGIAGTAAEAQAFKRACSRFGLGRYLYDLPSQWVGYDARSKRLLETPSLPTGKPVHPRQARGERAAGTAELAPEKPAKPTPPILLDAARASALHRQLANLGLTKRRHYRFASEVLGRKITTLTGLDEREAYRVYQAARQLSQETAA